ncbi:hypothetical protein CENSYa_0645 [Cenarchaeum symbiosum A]|uniref:Uncharacterized protein n=1 Tax=Cenarchaeum symbiosum (strain A) TaxID=414004 RepID=A0RVB1_CENSY|nr:hypothetical protein CENSYa_0645 [Cenarchaeum symbiosum A]
MEMSQETPCIGECSKFRAMRPESGGRLQAGQCLCWNCGIWLAPHESHTDGGQSQDAGGPYCNCCNRILCTPRPGLECTGLGHFSRPKAEMLEKIVRQLAGGEGRASITRFIDSVQNDDLLAIGIQELGIPLYEMVDLAYTYNPPNKLSMLLELETVRKKLGHVPDRSEMNEHSAISVSVYDGEFQSWDRMLELLGHDPGEQEGPTPPKEGPEPAGMSVDEMKLAINNALQNEPEILELFEKLSRVVPHFDGDELDGIIRSVRQD